MFKQKVDNLLIDNYQRRFHYLRLSITELCNFRCQYCLPNGYLADQRPHFLSLNEINHVVKAFSELGIKKIRLTGGEPTLRRDFTEIVALVAQYTSINEIALTTNGSRLFNQIEEWKQAGLTAINVSVDSFLPNMFRLITGENRLHQVIAGIDKALTVGLKKVKINTVLMKGLNDNLQDYLPWIKDRVVDLRFIELMETSKGVAFFSQHHVSGLKIEQQLLAQGWQLMEKNLLAGPAKVYQHPDYAGRIGLILPYSKDFCQSCNRLRVSSTGKLHYCLFGESAMDLRDLLQTDSQSEQLKVRILSSLKIKPPTHYLHQHSAGLMQNLSIIGG